MHIRYACVLIYTVRSNPCVNLMYRILFTYIFYEKGLAVDQKYKLNMPRFELSKLNVIFNIAGKCDLSTLEPISSQP